MSPKQCQTPGAITYDSIGYYHHRILEITARLTRIEHTVVYPYRTTTENRLLLVVDYLDQTFCFAPTIPKIDVS